MPLLLTSHLKGNPFNWTLIFQLITPNPPTPKGAMLVAERTLYRSSSKNNKRSSSRDRVVHFDSGRVGLRASAFQALAPSGCWPRCPGTETTEAWSCRSGPRATSAAPSPQNGLAFLPIPASPQREKKKRQVWLLCTSHALFLYLSLAEFRGTPK